MYLGARSLGISATRFWQSSPRELSWEAEACRERFTQERKRTKELAWLMAALSRQKKIPSLEKFIEEAKVEPKQTWQDIKSALRTLTNG